MRTAELETNPELLQFSCDHCQAELAVPVVFAGVTGPCPHCKQETTAPHLMERQSRVEPVRRKKRERTQSAGIALFEKKGFRLVRVALSVGACVVLFMTFHALKTRRWELPNQSRQTVQTPGAAPLPLAPNIEQETIPENPALNGVTPPALPNLRPLSARQ